MGLVRNHNATTRHSIPDAAAHAAYLGRLQADTADELKKPSAPERASYDVRARAPFDVARLEAAVHQDAPQLPNPTGAYAPAQTVYRSIDNDAFVQGCSIFAVLQTMTETRQNDMILAQLIKRMRTQASMLSKQRDLWAKADEIKASNTSATSKLIASGLATGLSGVAAWFFRFQDVGINQAIMGSFDYWDRTYGGQSRANNELLEQKQESAVSQQEQTRIDAASAWYEQVKEARKNAQQAIMTHVQLVSDAANSVWR